MAESKRLHPVTQEYSPSYNDISTKYFHAAGGHRQHQHSSMPPSAGVHRAARHQKSHPKHRFCEECNVEHVAEWRECAECNDEHSGCCNASATKFFYKGQRYCIKNVTQEDGEESLTIIADKN